MEVFAALVGVPVLVIATLIVGAFIVTCLAIYIYTGNTDYCKMKRAQDKAAVDVLVRGWNKGGKLIDNIIERSDPHKDEEIARLKSELAEVKRQAGLEPSSSVSS